MSSTYYNTVYTAHAVKRIMQRRLPLDAVYQIAQVGITVQKNGSKLIKRGDIGGKPVHVVLENNTVITVYVADEFESTVTIQRKRPIAIGCGA